MRTIWRAELANALMVISAALLLGSCSSPSAPTEPVVYNLVSVHGNPLPTFWSSTTVNEGGTLVVYELYALHETFTLAPDGTWLRELRAVRRRDGVVVEDFGLVHLWGFYEWRGDSLIATRTGPPTPDGAVDISCCVSRFRVAGDGQFLRGFIGPTLWLYERTEGSALKDQ